MRKRTLLTLACLLPLASPSLAEPSWDEAVAWLRNKFVDYGPYIVQSRELDDLTFTYHTTSITGDGCNLVVRQENQFSDGSKTTKWPLEYVFPVKNYHRIEQMKHRNHGYTWLEVHSLTKDIRYTGSEGNKGQTGDMDMHIDIDAYPDFVQRLDAAFKRLSALASSNAACGKPEAF